MSAPIVLPRDVYDTYEFSALVYGGIGARHLAAPPGKGQEEGMPYCIVGHHFAAGLMDHYRAPILTRTNDDAVARINTRKGCEPSARVSWVEFCAELNIQRGKS